MSGTFVLRVVEAGSARAEEGHFELEPTQEHAERVCALLGEFLRGRPPVFRDQLHFLRRGGCELEWSAAGGAAFAALYEDSAAVSLALLLTGSGGDAAEGLRQGFLTGVLNPLEAGGPQPESLLDGSGPRVCLVLLPGHAELRPLIELLHASLASVYFRSAPSA